MMKFKLTLTFCILDTVLIIDCQPHFGGYNLPELHSTNLHESVFRIKKLKTNCVATKMCLQCFHIHRPIICCFYFYYILHHCIGFQLEYNTSTNKNYYSVTEILTEQQTHIASSSALQVKAIQVRTENAWSLLQSIEYF